MLPCPLASFFNADGAVLAELDDGETVMDYTDGGGGNPCRCNAEGVGGTGGVESDAGAGA